MCAPFTAPDATTDNYWHCTQTETEEEEAKRSTIFNNRGCNIGGRAAPSVLIWWWDFQFGHCILGNCFFVNSLAVQLFAFLAKFIKTVPLFIIINGALPCIARFKINTTKLYFTYLQLKFFLWGAHMDMGMGIRLKVILFQSNTWKFSYNTRKLQ